MKTHLLLLSTALLITTNALAQNAPAADGSAMQAGDIARQWQKTTTPAVPGIRTRGLTRGGAEPVLRTRGAGLSQQALEANADVLESLHNRGMKILKGDDAAAAHAVQSQASAALSATPVQASTPPPPAFVEVPVLPEKADRLPAALQKRLG